MTKKALIQDYMNEIKQLKNLLRVIILNFFFFLILVI